MKRSFTLNPTQAQITRIGPSVLMVVAAGIEPKKNQVRRRPAMNVASVRLFKPMMLVLILTTSQACQDSQGASPLTREDRIGEAFFTYYFSHTNQPGIYFLSQFGRQELNHSIMNRLTRRFAPAGLRLLNKRDAQRRYIRYSERADSTLSLVDPKTGSPGSTLSITGIQWVSGDTVDVTFIFGSFDEVRKNTYTLRRETSDEIWDVIAFKTLSIP